MSIKVSRGYVPPNTGAARSWETGSQALTSVEVMNLQILELQGHGSPGSRALRSVEVMNLQILEPQGHGSPSSQALRSVE